jgi:hypothetical protein
LLYASSYLNLLLEKDQNSALYPMIFGQTWQQMKGLTSHNDVADHPVVNVIKLFFFVNRVGLYKVCVVNRTLKWV